jgi:hypothetical protein
VGQVLPPKPQMMAKQDWRYVSGGGQARAMSDSCAFKHIVN